MSNHDIVVGDFEAHASTGTTRSRKNLVSRDWARSLGFVGTLLLHSLAILAFSLGLHPYKALPNKLKSPGVESVAGSTDALMLVSIAELKRTDLDPSEQAATLGIHLTAIKISVSEPTVAIDLTREENTSVDAPPIASDVGDSETRALMLGRYVNQINARIERAWLRPRQPIYSASEIANTRDARGSSETSFRCRVQIRQDERRYVQEVLLIQCNGTEAWQHSLVVAINQSSPLPAPPIPSVFSQWVTLAFEAFPYQSGMSPDSYEPEAREMVN